MSGSFYWDDVSQMDAEYTAHINQILDELQRKPEVLRALNEIGDKHNLPPLTEKLIAQMLYGQSVGRGRRSRKTRKTRKHGKRISRK